MVELVRIRMPSGKGKTTQAIDMCVGIKSLFVTTHEGERRRLQYIYSTPMYEDIRIITSLAHMDLRGQLITYKIIVLDNYDMMSKDILYTMVPLATDIIILTETTVPERKCYQCNTKMLLGKPYSHINDKLFHSQECEDAYIDQVVGGN